MPIVNMVMVSFLLKHGKYLTKRAKQLGVLGGVLITAYFHITQALGGIVNWAMPSPWHWNILGVWHAIYMLTVASLVSIFLFVSVKYMEVERKLPWQFVFCFMGLLVFLIILRLDYIDIKIF